MATSPELAAGLGFTFEDAVTAVYLSALLREGNAAGTNGHIITRVAQQQKDFGEPLDDVIVDFQAANGDAARLSLQVKRELTVSAAESNKDFRAVVCEAYATVRKTGFRENRDRLGAVTGTISDAKKRVLETTCEWARASLSGAAFLEKIEIEGHASDEQRAIVQCFREIIGELADIPDLDEAVFRVLKHFTLIHFDLLHAGSTTEAAQIDLLRSCLHVDDASKAPILWSSLRLLAREGGGRAATYDRVSLLPKLAGGFRFGGAPSLSANLQQLSDEARHALHTIRDDIAGVPLARRTLVNQADAQVAQHRFVQIIGQPGVGKSVILRRLIERALEKGPVLLLKSDRLAGKTWPSYASAIGLSPCALPTLLAEIGHTGTAVLFIDGLDRIESGQRGIILDLLHAINADAHLRQQWRIIATVRDNGIELLRNWLPATGLTADNVGLVSVESLNDEEVGQLARAKPELHHILTATNKASKIARRPFFIAELARLLPAANNQARLPRTETELIEIWWQRAGLSSDEALIGAKQECLIKLANQYGQCMGRPISSKGLNHLALRDLKSDGVIRDVRTGHTVTFCHDIFFEWSLFHTFLDQGEDWLTGLREMGQAPAFGRIVELLSQDCYFSNGEWAQQLAVLDATDLRSQWARAWMMAPVCSPLFNDANATFTTAILQADSDRVRRLAVWFQAEKTQPNPRVFTDKAFATYPRHELIRIADYWAWPSDIYSWENCCAWLLQHLPKCDVTTIPDILTVFEVWQNALQGVENHLSSQIVAQVRAWLIDIEDRYHAEKFGDRDHGKWECLEGRDAVEDLEKRLRNILLRAAAHPAAATHSYLQRVAVRPRLLERIYKEIIEFSPSLAAFASNDLANLTLARFLETLPCDKLIRRTECEVGDLMDEQAEEDATNALFQEIGYGNDFSDRDWRKLAISDDHKPWATPLCEPFATLFASAPNEAHSLVRTLCNHAIRAWRQLNALAGNRDGTPLPLELSFPWGPQAFWGDSHEYAWFRGAWAPSVIRSGLMALEAWAFAQLESGHTIDQVIKEVVQGHECCAVLGIASALALSQTHLSSTTLSLATCQQLWLWDIERTVHEGSSHSNMIGFDCNSPQTHIDAVRAGNERPCRRIDVRQLAFGLVVHHDEQLRGAAQAAICAFPQNIPFRFEEQKQDAQFIAGRQHTAAIWAEIGHGNNYSLEPTTDKHRFQLKFDNPKLKEAPAVVQLREHEDRSSRLGLLMWANQCIETQQLAPSYTIAAALQQAIAMDVPGIIDAVSTNLPFPGNPADIIAAVAATAICFADQVPEDERKWAENALLRTLRVPNFFNEGTDAGSSIPFNPKIYAVKGLAACITQGSCVLEAQLALLQAAANPSEEVSAAAIHAGLGLWDTQPDFAWLMLDLALQISIGQRPKKLVSAFGYGHDSNMPYLEQVASLATNRLGSIVNWDKKLVSLPAAWGELFESPNIDHILKPRFPTRRKIYLQEPDPFLRWDFLRKFLLAIPVAKMMRSAPQRTELLHLCEQLVLWTTERLHPLCLAALPPKEQPEMRKAQLWEWNDQLFRFLAYVALELDLNDAKNIILQPLARLKTKIQISLLQPFITELSCIVMDRPILNLNAIELLKNCAHHLMTFKDWRDARVGDGRIHKLHWSIIIQSICFVQVESARLSARFANGNWQDIESLLPVFDPMIKAGGDIIDVTDAFFTLCERAIKHYPTTVFIEQVQAFFALQQGVPTGWRGTVLMSRLATLIQLFAEKSLPLEPAIAQAMLAILDRLVDMGNRRAAALRGSDSFRAIRIS